MAIAPEPDLQTLFADKKAIQAAVTEQNARIGFVKDPTATPQKARAMMRALGIHPEDNEFSRDIIATRERR